MHVYPLATLMGKTALLRVRIEPELHKNLLDTLKARDVSASRAFREFMKRYLPTLEQTPQLDYFRQTRQTRVD